MSPHTCIIFLLKPTKRNKKEEEGVVSMWDKEIDDLHMKTKCPKQHGRLSKKEDHLYVPRFEIKPHPKNA
jgi:hypothetical protein